MPDVIPFESTHPTMGSRDIAELVKSRHDNVKRAIERLFEKGVIGVPPMEEYRDSLNRTAKEYRIGKRDSYVIVAQLSPEFTAALVDRWQELEQRQSQKALPQNYLQALEKLVESERARVEASAEAERLQVVCQTITNQFKPGLTPPAFCRQFNGVNTQKVQKFLVGKGYLLATNLGYRAASPYRDKYFAEKRGDVDEGSRSTEFVTVTLAGAKRLYKMYLAGDLPMKVTWDGSYSHLLFENDKKEAITV